MNPFKRNLKIYRSYVCPCCFNQINKCVCEVYPPYTLVQIDEGLQKAIRELNKKGYWTRFSCEGHYDYSYNIYVKFEDKYDFAEIPNGFIKEGDFVIRHNMKNLHDENLFNLEKQKYLEIFEKWAEGLKAIT